MNGWRTLLPNAWYVAQREFRSRVRTRSFLAGTILLAAIAFAVTQLPVLIDFAMTTSQTKIAVVAQASDLPSDSETLLVTSMNQVAGMGGEPFEVTWLGPSNAEQAARDLEAGKYAALLTIDRSATGDLTFTLRTDMAADGRQVGAMKASLPLLAIEDRLVRAGTSFAGVANVNLEIKPVSAASAPAKSTSEEISSNLVSTGLIVLIFMAIVTYGTWVAMSVAEEKGSRVMELMLNATTPLQMLTGKVVGNGAAGLTQYGAILGAVLAGMVAQGPIRREVLGTSSSSDVFGGLTPTVLVAFMLLFVGGFLLYSLLYAGLGSLVSRQEDIQSATSPLMMLVFIGYFSSVFALQAIDEPWVKLMSYIPFFSPYLMLARVSVGHVDPWEFVLAGVLLVAAIAAALVVAARIYSAGVLLYGQRVGLRQILGAARVSR
jgi:ABC-2 type transport system permease protein